jgi:hypothetical protein
MFEFESKIMNAYGRYNPCIDVVDVMELAHRYAKASQTGEPPFQISNRMLGSDTNRRNMSIKIRVVGIISGRTTGS